MSLFVRLATLLAFTSACSSPVPLPSSAPIPAEVATPMPSPSPPPGIAGPSPLTAFPRPTERFRGITAGEDSRLPACDASIQPRPAARRDTRPATAGLVDLEVVGQLGGRPRAAVIADGRLYVGVGPRVQVFETDPWRPAVASALLPGSVRGLAVDDGLIVAALGDAGLAVLRSHADGLRLSASLELPGPSHGVALNGGIAFVAAGPAGLVVVGLSDPARPAILGALSSKRDVLGVAMGENGMVLAAAGAEGLLVANVSDPRTPRAMGELFTGGHAFAVQLAGATAYLADGWGGMRIVDVSDPSRPRSLGALPLAGWAWHVAIDGDVAHVAAGSQGLVVVDVSRPDRPTAIATTTLAGAQAVAVVVHDGIAYVVDPFEGVQIVDVRSPASPRPIGSWQPLLEGWGLADDGSRIYVAAGRAGLRAVDISAPKDPRDVGALPTVAKANAVRVSGDSALVSTQTDAGSEDVYALIQVDVSGLDMQARSAYGQMGRVGRAAFPSGESVGGPGAGPAVGLATSGSVSIYANEHGFLIVDTGGSVPCELAFLPTWSAGNGEASAAALNGDVAFLVAGSGGFDVFAVDISDPREVQVLSSVRASAGKGALVNGRWLYTAGYGVEAAGSYFDIVDVGDPTRARRVGSLKLPAEPAYFSTQPMVFAGGRVFIAAAEGGLLAVDVSDPTRPRLAGRLAVPGQALSVISVDDHLYVGSDEAGLLVVEVRPEDEAADQRPRRPEVLAWSGLAATIDSSPVALAPETSPTPASGCVVTAVGDDGPGSLRDCLDRVRAGQAVTFDPALFSPERPATIQLRSPLELGSGGITVDGGGGVVLDGSASLGIGGWAGYETSFEFIRDGVTVRGLRIQGFRVGLWIRSDGNTIEGNVIADSVEAGLILHHASGNRVVRNDIGKGVTVETGSAMNLVAANRIGGSVYVSDAGSYNNSFIGNRIGVDANGRPAPAPCDGGVAPSCQLVLDEPFNRAGGLLPGEGNIVAWRVVHRAGAVVLGNEIVSRTE